MMRIDAQPEDVGPPQHQDPEATEHVGRGAHDGADRTADRRGRQRVPARRGLLLHADDAGGHGDVAEHHDADDDALADDEGPMPPAGRDQGGERQGQADAAAPRQDAPDVLIGQAEGGADLGLARRRDGEGEDAVEVEAGRGERGHREDAGDQERPADDVELLAVQHVELDVQHGDPDPHGGDDLDHGQTPVRVEELHALEQHEEGAHDQGQWGEPTLALAELEHGLLHRLVVAAADGVDEPLHERPDARPPAEGGAGVGRSGRPGALRCAPIVVVHRHWPPLIPVHRAVVVVPRPRPATPHPTSSL